MTIDKYVQQIKDEYSTGIYDPSIYKSGDKVEFYWVWVEEPEIHVGKISIIDKNGGGLCSGITPSYDIDCEDATYKHVSIVHLRSL